MKDIRCRAILAALLGVAVLLMGTTAMAAPAKTKLVYWTMWEPNPVFTAYLEEAGREFA
jgi:ABC-type glycerol-3-phosphate transport system substrate-binding protein